jgi:N-acyl-D-aspartate/D-glutamate deacylase
MADLIISGATVINGLGGVPVRQDIGVEDGRIVPAQGSAGRCIDAEGLVLCPGFIDVHTHYDAQMSWDPDVAPSTDHGVTTIIAGNCGFGLAPLNTRRDAEWLMHMMSRVEGMPLEALSAGVSWDWSGFGEWLSRLDNRLAVNAGVFAGHSTIRDSSWGSALLRWPPTTTAPPWQRCSARWSMKAH